MTKLAVVRLDALDAAAVHGESLLPTAAPPVPHRGTAPPVATPNPMQRGQSAVHSSQ